MKRILCFLCVVLILCLCGCGTARPDAAAETPTPAASEPTATPAPTAAPGENGNEQTQGNPTTVPENPPAGSQLTGETVFFGAYEQDNNGANGPEPIESIVLEERDGAKLLLSRYCLLACNYKVSSSSQTWTWDRSTLRELMNADFYKAAFTDKEKSQILSVHLNAEGNPVSGGNAGEDTEDRVFALSALEAQRYFPDPLDRRGQSTDAARTFMLYTERYPSSSGQYCAWWLRNPGHGVVGSLVDPYGEIESDWKTDALYSICMRPALYICAEDAPVEEVDADGLVREILHLEGTTESSWGRTDRLISIPEIRLDSDDVKEINEKAASLWNENWKPENMDEDAIPISVEYSAYVNGDILSLVIHSLGYYGDDSYFVYNVRISDGTALDNQDVLNAAQVADGDLDALCKDAIGRAIDELAAAAGKDAEAMFNAAKSMALQRNYHIDDADFYLGENSLLSCAMRIDWLAGSGFKNLDICLTPSA